MQAEFEKQKEASGYGSNADFIDYLLQVSEGKQVDGVALKDVRNLLSELSAEIKKQGVNINIVSNCNLKDGKSFCRGMPELKEMSYFFGEQCRERGLIHSVRGSKLGSRFTVAGIREYMQEKEQEQVEYRRIMHDIEEEKQYIDDYEEWHEEAKKAGDSFYEAFDHFQADHDVSENDEEIFYGSVFQEFNEQWRKENGYTWHERNDMVICDLAPTKINSFFGHLGGVSECKKCRMV